MMPTSARGPAEWSVVTRAEVEVLRRVPERRVVEPRERWVALSEVPVCETAPSEGGPS
jgi:hypothetical protein